MTHPTQPAAADEGRLLAEALAEADMWSRVFAKFPDSRKNASPSAEHCIVLAAAVREMRAREGCGWQPIETAPRERGQVLATHVDDFPSIEVLNTPFFMHNGELSCMNQNSANMTKIRFFTHWMPLTPPPATEPPAATAEGA